MWDLKKEYWILHNGKEVVKEHGKGYEVGSIHSGYCPDGICASSGSYIVFKDGHETNREILINYLIMREYMAINKHM